MPTTTSNTSLAPATEELRAGLAGQLGEEVLDAFDRDAEAMGGDPPYAGALDVGATAPEFTLPDARSAQVSLSTLLAVGPVVLVFYRGAWCPYCNLQLAAFQSALADIRAAGAALVAVSPQTPDQSLTRQVGDVARRVQRGMGSGRRPPQRRSWSAPTGRSASRLPVATTPRASGLSRSSPRSAPET